MDFANKFLLLTSLRSLKRYVIIQIGITSLISKTELLFLGHPFMFLVLGDAFSWIW